MALTPSNPAPLVSIVIPSYQTADLISACLESVLAQTFQDFEALVINDGSPDTAELEKVLQPYMGRIVYIKQENKRAAGARNNGIRRARGEFIAFLDSDDTWLPNHLENQSQLLQEDPSLDFVYANALLVGDPAHEPEFMEKCPSSGEATFQALIVERCQIPISTVVVRRESLLKAGLFDETLLRCDDYDMWLRCAFHGAKIGYRKTVQARLLIGRPGSLSVSRARMAEAYWRILEKTAQSLPLSDSDRRVVVGRAAEIKGQYLLEEGKAKLAERKFDQARALLAEANGYLRKSALSLAVFGLDVAPKATGRVLNLWARRRNGSPA